MVVLTLGTSVDSWDRSAWRASTDVATHHLLSFSSTSWSEYTRRTRSPGDDAHQTHGACPPHLHAFFHPPHLWLLHIPRRVLPVVPGRLVLRCLHRRHGRPSTRSHAPLVVPHHAGYAPRRFFGVHLGVDVRGLHDTARIGTDGAPHPDSRLPRRRGRVY